MCKDALLKVTPTRLQMWLNKCLTELEAVEGLRIGNKLEPRKDAGQRGWDKAYLFNCTYMGRKVKGWLAWELTGNISEGRKQVAVLVLLGNGLHKGVPLYKRYWYGGRGSLGDVEPRFADWAMKLL